MLAIALLTLISTEAPDAKALFARHCAICHGADGSGKTIEGVKLPGPSLLDPKRRAAWKPEAVAAQILDGKSAMPAHRPKLKPEEADRIAKWLVEGSAKKKGK